MQVGTALTSPVPAGNGRMLRRILPHSNADMQRSSGAPTIGELLPETQKVNVIRHQTEMMARPPRTLESCQQAQASGLAVLPLYEVEKVICFHYRQKRASFMSLTTTYGSEFVTEVEPLGKNLPMDRMTASSPAPMPMCDLSSVRDQAFSHIGGPLEKRRSSLAFTEVRLQSNCSFPTFYSYWRQGKVC
jgi:hypothetical protein